MGATAFHEAGLMQPPALHSTIIYSVYIIILVYIILILPLVPFMPSPTIVAKNIGNDKLLSFIKPTVTG